MNDIDPDKIEENIRKLENKIKDLQGECVLASERSNDEGLSKHLMNLARTNSALGKYAALANYIARNADRAARRGRAEKTLGYAEKEAVNKSELKAEVDSKDAFLTASDAQLLADQASDLCFRTDTFLKMAQSRLSLMKGDKRG